MLKPVLLRHCFIAIGLVFSVATTAIAADGRADYDLDDDGLIEIDDLADLNAMRDDMDGTSLYGVTTGCPVDGCFGYELMADLDFDTDGDDTLDASDDFWNEGLGWEPIGAPGNSFSADFEGNSHTIANLYIDRSTTDYVGLFGATSNANIRNLGLTGELMSITGDEYVGAIAGAGGGTVTGVYVTGFVSGTKYVGGIVGTTDFSSLIGNVFAGHVNATEYAGGIAGRAFDYTNIESSFVSGSVTSGGHAGGLAGYSANLTIEANLVTATLSGSTTGALFAIDFSSTANTTVTNYWAETTGESDGYSRIELQCPEADNDVDCADNGNELFSDWWDYIGADSNEYWDFGTATQLPGLYLNGIVIRDSDGDGSLDGDDPYPNDYDNDGVDDSDDAFPEDETETVDTDGDGIGDNSDTYPEDFDNDGVDDSEDEFPTDPSESADTDGDGIGDNADTYPNDFDNDALDDDVDTDDDNDGVSDVDDAFPYDATESEDGDGDGVGNNSDVDLDNDGLIEIDNFDDLADITNHLDGSAQYGSSAGCASGGCDGFELTTDLDFDTNSDGIIDANDSYWQSTGYGDGWQPIGDGGNPFTGTFDGNDYRIRNLVVDTPYTNAGLFASVNDATFTHLIMDGDLTQISASSYAGLLFGHTDDNGVTINDSYFSGTVSVSSETAGFAGGIAGSATGASLSNIQVSATINSTGTYTGGIFGSLYSESFISSTVFEGEVNGAGSVGGLFGLANNALVYTSFVDADITGSADKVGGLIGELNASAYPVEIVRSFVEGSVTGAEQVGGMVGLGDSSGSFTIKYSFVASDVEGSDIVGGLVGYVRSDLTLTDVLAYGPVRATIEGPADVGGLVGASDPITYYVTDSYWDTDTTGQSSSDDGQAVGLTTVELQCPTEAADLLCATSVYVGWDNDLWDFGSSTEYPTLYVDGVAARDSDEDDIWDFYDAFPDDAAASIDDDNDGFPDEWNDSCDSDCQNASDLTLDDDPTEPFVEEEEEQPDDVDAGSGSNETDSGNSSSTKKKKSGSFGLLTFMLLPLLVLRRLTLNVKAE